MSFGYKFVTFHLANTIYAKKKKKLMKNSVKESAPFPHPLYTLYMFMFVYFMLF